MKRLNITDAHQHFWQLTRADYGWLTPDLTEIYRDFNPQDLLPLIKDNGVSGTILVQAAATEAETHFLLETADQFDWILGVVGWIDFESPSSIRSLDTFAENPKFLGVRPMLQDIGRSDWILNPDFNALFAELVSLNLTFDALITPRHLNAIQRLADRFPNLRIVIDHGAKPAIRDQQWDSWQTELALLASRPNTFCKLSGLITEAQTGASLQQTDRYIREILDQFGSARCLWGSDWPVCTLATSYQDWLAHCIEQVETYSEDALKKVFNETAREAYARIGQ